ncbi:carbon-nitrogen hydrolase family protein [Occallatibacter riparius]|uniref:Conjugal transfer protein TraB n=1 Tax=Occallatibacter riparius TaxID=1002689 RepID=A0A9J7BRA3_9BACT|nr:hypothetical protein [Occallatibacter riparius]UWZ85111.1 hypothetical protein MOP44_04005 [Occallatibacter riparius]
MFPFKNNHTLSLSIGSHAASRAVMLFAAAALIGFLGWSGVARLSWISLLYPFLYLQSRSRLESLSAVFYYAGATWSVIPGSAVFFGTNASFALPLLLFLGCITLGGFPWILLYNRRLTEVSAIAALVVLALPPLSFVTVAHPLISAGQWFPATRWFGILLPLLAILLYRWFGQRYTAGVLLASFLVTHVRWIPPTADPHVAAIDTHFGGTAFVPLSPSVLYQQERLIQNESLKHPDAVVLFPETIVPAWSRMTDTHWSGTFRALEQQHTTLLLGTTVPVPATEGSRNILLARGFGPHFAYVQRIPVPLAMWHFGGSDGFPLMLRYPPTIRVLNQHAAVLMCYEQLLVWPAMQSLARNPDMLLAPSNDYWASKTPIPAIQHEAARDWADLWDIPLYEARNE